MVEGVGAPYWHSKAGVDFSEDKDERSGIMWSPVAVASAVAHPFSQPLHTSCQQLALMVVYAAQMKLKFLTRQQYSHTNNKTAPPAQPLEPHGRTGWALSEVNTLMLTQLTPQTPSPSPSPHLAKATRNESEMKNV
ncbi:unnamed protein product [Ceratitis capitata]|uniref:(Mediterranean fruit fly) hypothetical protein n=1 Tax=Ceratitis capitata TaxID=7213 RepID=A0A811V7H5_CERCA|nr:unnamed protein product [Ceratitis capitata]